MTSIHDTVHRTAGAAVFLAPGEGTAIQMGSLPLIFKALSAWTGGAYEMHEQPLRPGVLVPPHIHAHQDQVSYVVTGTLGFLVGGEEFEAPAGSFIWRPRGIMHALWNAASRPARMLEISSPGMEIEKFFRAFGALTDQGNATREAVAELAEPYGISYDYSLVEDLEARHRVSAAGGWWRK